MSETTVPAIDLDTTVTREQYISAVEGLLPVLDDISDDRGWCTERHRYFRAVMFEYMPVGVNERAGADFSQVPEDTDYAARLRSMRARVLWYVRNDTISPEIGDRILTGLGLRLANQARKPGERIRAHIDVELNVGPGDDGSARSWATHGLPALIVRLLDASPDAGRYIPASAVASCYSTDRLSTRASIPETDTERPSYT